MPEIGIFPITLDVNFPYRILTISVKGFMGYTENPVYGHMKIRLYFVSTWLKIGIARQLFAKVSRVSSFPTHAFLNSLLSLPISEALSYF
jgi:hypothetical protein